MSRNYDQIAGQKVQRLEAISDGVFAIALTLLVLDIHVPVGEAIHSEAALAASLCTLAPKFLSYFLSFMTLGIFWTGHATQYNYIEKSDRHLNWLCLFFLLFVSILPFTTAFLSEHITFRLAIGLYWLNIFAMGVMVLIHWKYACHQHYLSIEGEEEAAITHSICSRIFIAQALYAGGALLCFINTYLSIVVIVLVQLNYAFAPFARLNTKKHSAK